MADRALAVPTMLVLNAMRYLAPDAPREVNLETLRTMRCGLVEEIDRLDRRFCRLSELTDFFEDGDEPPGFEDFRNCMTVFFPNKTQEEAEAYFVFSYNRYIKAKDEPWVKHFDEALFCVLLEKYEDFADITEDAGISHSSAIDELHLLVKIEDLLMNRVTRLLFFDEMKKFGINLRDLIDV